MKRLLGGLILVVASAMLVVALAPSAGAGWGKHEMSAPVYFANGFPEYTLGSPDIYAGYDEADTVFLAPVKGKGPHHYAYWNQMYNENPYYGKSWDKNWTVFGANGYYGGQYWDGPRMKAVAGYPGYGGGYGSSYAAPGVGAKFCGRRAACEKCQYQTCPTENAYQGHYISNFDSFCNQECVRPIFPCLARIKAALGCHSCFGCCDPYVVPCCDPCEGICFDDFCSDPCFDPCAGYLGCFVEGEACCGQNEPMTEPAAVSDTPAAEAPLGPASSAGDGTVSTEPAVAVPEKNPNTLTFPSPAGGDNLMKFDGDNMLPQSAPPTQTPKATPAPADPNGGKTGYIQLTVPEDAVVFINGYQTKMTGTERQFVARGLEIGRSYEFEIRVTLVRSGEVLNDVQTAVLLPGTTMALSFRFDRPDDLQNRYAVK